VDYEDNTGETEDGAGQKSTLSYWHRFIPAAKKAAKRHWDDARAAWLEYTNDLESGAADKRKRSCTCPIYFSSTKHIESAYYGQTPKTRSRRRFDIDDPIALTMAFVTDRLGEQLIDGFDFDGVMEAGVGDFVHADKTSMQLIYKPGSSKKRVPLSQGPDGALYAEGANEPYDGEPSQDEQGVYHEIESAEDGEISLSPLCFDEVVHTPDAKTWAEIRDMAFKFCMPYEEACQKFCIGDDGQIDHEKAKKLPWKTNKDYAAEDETERSDAPGKYLEAWECYCLDTRKVYFVCEGHKDGFLREPADDPYGLKHFFPCAPFIIGSKPPKSLYPVPVFVHLEPTLRALDDCYNRVFDLVEKCRRKAAVSAEHPELLALFNTDKDWVSVANMGALLEKGGLEGLVQFLPVKELVESIGELQQLKEAFKADINEWFGVPDIIRGVGDPVETAKSAAIQTQSAHDRFKKNKRAVQRLARDGIEMMVDLALKVWTDQKIATVTGIEFAPPEHKQRFPEALARLRNDKERIVRVDIETDSTTFMDEAAELEKRNAIAKVLTDGLGLIGRMENPQFAGVALRMLLSVLSGVGGSNDFEDGVKQSVKELTEAKNQPPPQEPPDPKMMEVRLKAQAMQTDAVIKMREADRKDFEMQLKAQEAQSKLMQAQSKAQADALAAQVNQALLAIEQFRALLEERKVNAAEAEMIAEETRLAQEADTDLLRAENEMTQQVSEATKGEGVSLTIINAPQGGSLV
jgi:hypothetical protein